jgi:hypothetical protein
MRIDHALIFLLGLLLSCARPQIQDTDNSTDLERIHCGMGWLLISAISALLSGKLPAADVQAAAELRSTAEQMHKRTCSGLRKIRQKGSKRKGRSGKRMFQSYQTARHVNENLNNRWLN